jgi:hypothetical protein
MCARTLTRQRSTNDRSVHAAASRSLAALVPYHDDVAASCCDEALLIGALVRTLPERSPADACIVLALLCDLGQRLWKRELAAKELSNVLMLYSLPTLMDDALRRADTYGQPLVRRLAELCLAAAQHDASTMALQSEPAVGALAATLRDTVAAANFVDAAQLAAHLVSGASSSSGREQEGGGGGGGGGAAPGLTFVGDVGIASPLQQQWTRTYVTFGAAVQRASQCSVWLERRGYADSLSAILCAALTPNPPSFDVFQPAAAALALLLHDTPGAPHRLSVKHAHLPVLCMRLLQSKSEDRERLVLRWRRMGATGVAIEQLDEGHFDSLCEVLVWLTQHTPKNDPVILFVSLGVCVCMRLLFVGLTLLFVGRINSKTKRCIGRDNYCSTNFAHRLVDQ